MIKELAKKNRSYRRFYENGSQGRCDRLQYGYLCRRKGSAGEVPGYDHCGHRARIKAGGGPLPRRRDRRYGNAHDPFRGEVRPVAPPL